MLLEGIELMHIVSFHKCVILTSHANHYAISSEVNIIISAQPNLVQYIHTMAASKQSFEGAEKQKSMV